VDGEELWTALVAAMPAARRAAAQVVGDGPDAEDCASAALEHALTKTGIDAPAAWLREVARRRAVDLVRRRAAERRAIVRLATTAATPEPDLAERIVDRDAARWLAIQTQQLPSVTRLVLERIQHGQSAASVAVELQLTKRSVESHALRARRHLRAAWARTLSSIAAIGAYVRRALTTPSTPATGATLAAISATALLFSGAGSTPLARIPAPPPATSDGTSTPQAESRNDTPTQTPKQLATRRTSHARPTQGTRTPRRQQVAAVKTPIASETVSKQHRPGPDDPVGETLYCVSHLQVTTQHVGC
jgi:RNA polymerase sigma factor (sigma-70 family)